MSARTGEGLEEVCRALLQGEASLRRVRIDYKSPAYRSAMGKLSEYYLQ